MLSSLGLSDFLRTGLFGILLFALASPACGPQEGACTKNSDCTNVAQGCDPTTKLCTDIKCKKDSDCRGGWFCNADKKKCQKTDPAECREDSDCNNDEKCDQGKCVTKPECEKDSDCSSEKECKSNKCVTRGCKDDLDCGDNTKYECLDSKCVERKIECEKDGDCKDSQKPLCKNNKCIEKSGCANNADCTEPDKPLCLASKCVADTGAKEGKECETGKTDCKTGLVCYIEDKATSKGTCYKACLTFSPKCEKDQVCRQMDAAKGVCVPQNNGKKVGEVCEKEKTPCERDLFCVAWKGKKTCAAPCDSANPNCDTDDECYEVAKKRYACVSKREPCGPGRPCTENFVCVSGRCDPPPTCEGVKCKDEEVCQNGICRAKKCPNEMKCSGGLVCNSQTGKCTAAGGDPPCKPCAANAPRCPNTTDQCLTGLGNPNEAFCFTDCSANGTCADSKNFECRPISLTRNGVTCKSDGDCGGGGFKCNNGKCEFAAKLCIPKIGTCRNKCTGVTCTGSQVCAPTTGTCITTGKKLCDVCSVNDECGSKEDLCVNYGNNKTHCGQDCRSASCPSGYKCYSLSNGTFKQCAPANLQCPP